MKVYGTPIPLNYLTPNLLFYPFKLPKNVLLLSLNRDNVNCIDKRNVWNPSEKDHLDFVKTLMEYLNISYIIIGDILIDLNRQYFELDIDDNNNNVNISNYKSTNKVFYINEKFFNNKIKHLKLVYDKIYYNNNTTKDFINWHCQRISNNSKKIEQFVKDKLMRIRES